MTSAALASGASARTLRVSAELGRGPGAHPGELSATDDADDGESSGGTQRGSHPARIAARGRRPAHGQARGRHTDGCAAARLWPVTSTSPAGGLIARLRGAIDVLYREAIKFGVIGALAFVIDMGSFNLLRRTLLEDKPTAAVIVSASLATVFAWVGNRSWTFRHRRNRPAHHEAALFAGTNGVALVIQAAAVAFSNYVLDVRARSPPTTSPRSSAIGLGTLFRFWAYRRFVFAGEPIDVDTSPLADLGHHDRQP